MQVDLTGFPDRLKQAMEGARLTQADLARKSGLSDATISRLLIGRNAPTPETVRVLSKAANVPFLYLFSGATEPATPLFENEGDLYTSDFDPVRILIGRVRWVGQML